MRTSIQTKILLATSVLISLIGQPALADVVLPDINAKYVTIKEDNPTRDAGYVVGDILERTITLTVKNPMNW